MRPNAADVACSVVGLFLCWSHGCVEQKRLNRSRCRAESYESKEPCDRWGRDTPHELAILGSSGQLKIIGVSAAVYAAKGIFLSSTMNAVYIQDWSII